MCLFYYVRTRKYSLIYKYPKVPVRGIFWVLFLGACNNNKTGNKVRLVKVATNNVTEVNQPKANVPPKLLKQNIINPAIKTSDVYTILNPVCFMVEVTVAGTLLLCSGNSCL